jgi:hypothetical protein
VGHSQFETFVLHRENDELRERIQFLESVISGEQEQLLECTFQLDFSSCHPWYSSISSFCLGIHSADQSANVALINSTLNFVGFVCFFTAKHRLAARIF